MEELYKLQEEQTVGWVDITEPLTKEECKKYYDAHLNEDGHKFLYEYLYQNLSKKF